VQPSVHANIAELRRFLGSRTRALSYSDLAELLNARDTSRRRNASTVQRWEKSGVEPDLNSIAAMAELAGVTFQEFALGAVATTPTTGREALERAVSATSSSSTVEKKDVPAPRPGAKPAADKGRESA
jgi:transcriptional regulator with XRE-family HTH domain